MSDNSSDDPQVVRLGYSYRGRRPWSRRPPLPGYRYRRPVPCKDDEDTDDKASAQHKLESGWKEEDNGPPHDGGGNGGKDAGVDNGGEDAGGADGGEDAGGAVGGEDAKGADGGEGAGDADGGDADGDDGAHGGAGAGAGDEDDDDGLHTAPSSNNTSYSLDSDAAVTFAMAWDDEDGGSSGGQEDKGKKLAFSADPALFQEEREASRSMLAMGAFFASAAKAMVQEHKRAKKEADLYMDEVNLAVNKLQTTISAVFLHTSSFQGYRVDGSGGARPSPGQRIRLQALASIQGPLRGAPRSEEDGEEDGGGPRSGEGGERGPPHQGRSGGEGGGGGDPAPYRATGALGRRQGPERVGGPKQLWLLHQRGGD